MVKEAEENAEADKKRKELVEARNQGESLVHSTEKSLADHGDKVDAETKTSIETAISELKTALEGEDPEAITAKSQALAEASMKLGEAIYKAQAEESSESADPEAAGGATKSEDDVVDAEFEEVDENRKSSNG